MFSTTALLFSVTLTASLSLSIVCFLILCQTQLFRAEPHCFRFGILYGTRPFCNHTVLFLVALSDCERSYVFVLPALILKFSSAVAWPGPALPDKCPEIFLSWSSWLIIQMRRKWVFVFCFLFWFLSLPHCSTCVKIIDQGSFALSLPVQLTNAGNLKIAEIVQNTQEKCGEWGKHHHNHHGVWEDILIRKLFLSVSVAERQGWLSRFWNINTPQERISALAK